MLNKSNPTVSWDNQQLLSLTQSLSISSTVMDRSYRGVTPKKSPLAENCVRRRRDIKKAERAAYWGLFNTSVALLLYYDLCYLQVLEEISVVFVFVEWILCLLFSMSACYDYLVHFWPYTFMKPITVAPHDQKLLGIDEDEFGFSIEEPAPVKCEPVHDDLPPFEIHYSFDDDELEDRSMRQK